MSNFKGDDHLRIVVGSNGLSGSRNQTKPTPLTLVGVDISLLNQKQQFLVCSLGVFVFYLLYGYLQELIFTHRDLKAHGLYLTLVQFVLYSIFGAVEFKLVEKHIEKRIPTKMYVLLAFLTVATMALSNSSLGYLNFPTQVIFKSCKLIPVLLGGILIQNKKYGALDFIAAVVMCMGLAWFTLADSQASPNFNMTGVTMISLALLADAVIGNVQEKTMKQYGASNSEVVLYSYSLGIIYLVIALIASGQLVPSILVSFQNPTEMYFYGFLFSLTGYLGVNIVLTLVRTCGAFAAVTVTTFRKAVTIALSFLFFSKPFTVQYVLSGTLVMLGVYLNVLGKKGFSAGPTLHHVLHKLNQVKQTIEVTWMKQAASHRPLFNV